MIRNILAICILTAGIIPIYGYQSEYIEERQSGVGVMTSFQYVDGEPVIMIEPAYSIDGYVDIGIRMDLVWGEDQLHTPSREIDAAISLGFTVLKQSHFVPMTFLLYTCLHYLSESSDAYDAASIISSGTGFSIGGRLFRYFPVVHRLYCRYGLDLKHRTDTIVIDQISGAAGAVPLSSVSNSTSLELILGISYRPDTPNRGIAVSGDLGVGRDMDGKNRITGTVACTLVENHY